MPEWEERNSLDGRVAIVTGAAQGIGYAIAEDLARHGAAVVIVDAGVAINGEPQDAHAAEAAAAKLVAAGYKAAGLQGDVGETATSLAAVALAKDTFGGLDILVNNAAIIRDGFVFKSDPANWDATIRTNLSGAFRMVAAATPVMRDAGKTGRAPGAIVNILSTAGFYGNFGQAAYGSAKAGLFGLTRVAAHDLARAKVTSNAVIPFAATRVTESIVAANEAQAAYKDKAMQVPAVYVARLVTWLASPGGAHVTGQLFGVRGREMFLFSQPRPVARMVVPQGAHDLAGLGQAIAADMAPKFTDMVTDLESFSTDPVL